MNIVQLAGRSLTWGVIMGTIFALLCVAFDLSWGIVAVAFVTGLISGTIVATISLYLSQNKETWVESEPLSDVDHQMETNLLSGISRVLATGVDELTLLINGKKVQVYIRMRALYLPDYRGGDDIYFVITPAIKGNFYWANRFFEITSRVHGVSLTHLYHVTNAVEAWLESFHDAKDTEPNTFNHSGRISPSTTRH